MSKILISIQVVVIIFFGLEARSQENNGENSVEIVSSNLPLIFLNTGGNSIPDEPKINIHMGIIYNEGSRNNINDPFNNYDGNIGIETRGSSSSGWPKKSYSLETRTDSGTNLNVSLLGMPEENDWILNGPYGDKSLIRNILSFQLGNEMGRWSPRTRLCELFLNDEYMGVYVLMEKVKRDKNRVDIATLTEDEVSGDDITGGYIFKIDRPGEHWTSNYPSPVGNHSVPFTYVYPNPDGMPNDQKNYISHFVDDFEDALAGDDFKDPETGYRKYIDIASFVDYYLINEFSRNVDSYRLSTFLYKDKDSKNGKLNMGPLWDFNFSFGNAEFYDGYKTNQWMIPVPEWDQFQQPFWWNRLREDPYFNRFLKTKWINLRNGIFSYEHLESIIDSLVSKVDEAQVRNFTKFDILGEYVWANYFVADTYEEEIVFMKNWISDRLDWMDEQIMIINSSETESLALNSYEVNVYPNPIIDEINIEMYLLENATVEIALFDISGRVLYKRKFAVAPGYINLNIPTENIISNPGVYFYDIWTDGELANVGKLVKW